MAPRSVRARLDDMQEAIEGITTALRDVSYETFAESWQLRRAVERGLEIISEASRSLPPELKALTPDVPWQAVAAIGNILRHEYQRVEPAIVWNITAEHLPALARAVGVLASQAD
jgi:uncharacterized protein with HEPN domain